MGVLPAYDKHWPVFCSYGTGYRLTGDPSYKEVILTAAGSLAQRYNPNVGRVRSGGNKDDMVGDFNVIIDSLRRN